MLTTSASEIYVLLRLLQVDVETMQSSDTAEERAEKVDRFNRVTSSVQVFVTSIRIASFGFDFHRCCCKAILAAWPWNANTLNQILGRTVRLGQERLVEWQIYCVVGTIHEKHEIIMWRKFARQLAAESRLASDESLGGETGILAMYELIRALYNQPFNRYLWEALEKVDVGGFAHEGMLALSSALSEIARHAISTPAFRTEWRGRTALDLIAAAIWITRQRRTAPDEDLDWAELEAFPCVGMDFQVPDDLLTPKAAASVTKLVDARESYIQKEEKRAEKEKEKAEKKEKKEKREKKEKEKAEMAEKERKTTGKGKRKASSSSEGDDNNEEQGDGSAAKRRKLGVV